MKEEKHQRPFENNTSDEEEFEKKRPRKVRKPPFEGDDYKPFGDSVDHISMIVHGESLRVGNVFDQELEDVEGRMKSKRLQDEGYSD